MVNNRTDWVSWFDDDGRARHYRADSPSGERIVAALAELAGGSRRCAAPGCDKPIHGRADRRYCSDACIKSANRTRTKASIRARSRPKGIDLPDTPIARTNVDPSPQVDGHAEEPAIADTADISAPPERTCANCGVDISDRNADAKFCKRDACRKALARRAKKIAAAAELSDLLGQSQLFDVDTGGRL